LSYKSTLSPFFRFKLFGRYFSGALFILADVGRNVLKSRFLEEDPRIQDVKMQNAYNKQNHDFEILPQPKQ
jgi:hypothetical protein